MLVVACMLSVPMSYAQDIPPLEKSPKENLRMDSRLADLYESAIARNPDTAVPATLPEHGDRVQVILVMTSADAPVPQNLGIEVETSYENLVQATVPVRNLAAISSDDNVEFVNLPSKPVPAVVQPAADNMGSSIYYLLAIPVAAISVMAAILIREKKS